MEEIDKAIELIKESILLFNTLRPESIKISMKKYQDTFKLVVAATSKVEKMDDGTYEKFTERMKEYDEFQHLLRDNIQKTKKAIDSKDNNKK